MNNWITNVVYQQNPRHNLFDQSMLIDESFYESVLEFIDGSETFFTSLSKNNELNVELRRIFSNETSVSSVVTS